MGAKAVFIGRPILWGHAQGGEEGVNRVLDMINEELVNTMRIAGANSINVRIYFLSFKYIKKFNFFLFLL